MYDDLIIPPELIGVHYKAAIKARNRWMIDNSDVVMVYTIREYGGAFDAMKYAIKMEGMSLRYSILMRKRINF